MVWTSSLGLAALASLHYLRAHLGALSRVPATCRVSTALLFALGVVLAGAAYACLARGILSAVALGALVSALVGAHSLVLAVARQRSEPALGALLAWTAAGQGLSAEHPYQVWLWAGAGLLTGLALPSLAAARAASREYPALAMDNGEGAGDAPVAETELDE